MQVKFRGLWRHTAWMSTPGVVWGPVREGFQQQSYKVLYPTYHLALYVTGPGREGSQWEKSNPWLLQKGRCARKSSSLSLEEYLLWLESWGSGMDHVQLSLSGPSLLESAYMQTLPPPPILHLRVWKRWTGLLQLAQHADTCRCVSQSCSEGNIKVFRLHIWSPVTFKPTLCSPSASCILYLCWARSLNNWSLQNKYVKQFIAYC